ncbi:MAG TPA: RNA polymerase sigma factor [Myxococcaceae bacterium]|jgi:RNA polymerase sigma-70 factor (ECF subfamily)
MNNTSNDLESAFYMQQEDGPFLSRSKRCRASDRRLREFAVHRRDWLLYQARNVCRDALDMEDLVQETLLRFIRASDKLVTLPSERSWEAWLVTTLTRLFYDQCRRRTVQKREAEDLSLRGEVPIAREHDRQPADDTFTQEQFAQALHELSPKLRVTLELYTTGQSYQDIARTLGIAVGTVAKRLHDGRAKLREHLLRTNDGIHREEPERTD